jgi:2-polyprenyl-6-hydroxyphenyl methylase/3-demethylubiquinone-9 3-methyltransferase
VVDFHKNCESRRRQVLSLSGVPIYYYRCPLCRFLFTTAFDHFSREDFNEHIYNADYVLIDPDYLDARPRANANGLTRLFGASRPARVLDYGGGNGRLGECLTAAGFDVDIYDPLVDRFVHRPTGRYECILCLEVAEHSTRPAELFHDVNDLLSVNGIILLSTLLQPADIEQQGVNWWYLGPRNGHVSLFSRESLLKLVEPLGFHLASRDEGWHVLYREIPSFARHFIRSA